MSPKLNPVAKNFILVKGFSVASFLLIFILFLPALGFSQSKSKPKKEKKIVVKQLRLPKPGSLDYLMATNGYQDIVLGSDIKDLPQAKLAFLDGDSKTDADGCLKYEYKITDSLMQKDTTLTIDLIALRTYNNQIVNIYVFFRKVDGYNMLNTFLKNYGSFNGRPDNYKDIYFWNTDPVSLSLKYDLNVEEGVATFTCNPLADQLKQTTASHINADVPKPPPASPATH